MTQFRHSVNNHLFIFLLKKSFLLMIKAIKGLCRFSREHGIIKKKKKECRDHPSPAQVNA